MWSPESYPCESRRTLHPGWRALVTVMVIGTFACDSTGGGGTQPELPGSMTVTTETSGFMKDDSYDLLVNGESQGTIGANEQVTLSDLDPADYQVELGDVAANCSVDPLSVPVASEQTADVSLGIVCAPADPTTYTIQFSRERPNLDNGEITVCPFGICSTNEGWDLYVYNSTQTDPSSVIRQNETTGVEIAHVTGVALADLTEEDFQAATFTTEIINEGFGTGRTILVRTDLGNVYALGNPVEDATAATLTFDAALIVQP